MKTIAFFNNKGGVGKTSLVYHLAWMMSLLGRTVVVADLDPQENATSMFLTDDELEAKDENRGSTIVQMITPAIQESGSISADEPLRVAERLFLIPGSLSLSNFEDRLSVAWLRLLEANELGVSATKAIAQAVKGSAEIINADIALMDLGPNLGAINRAALIASDYIVVPLSADLFAIQGLQSVGAKLREWRAQWREMSKIKGLFWELGAPLDSMEALGYVVSRHSALSNLPSRSSSRWIDRVPDAYRWEVLGKQDALHVDIGADPNCLALLKDYRSLMPLAQEARKPMFLLKPGDGAIGGHQNAVQSCRSDFEALAQKILLRVELKG